MIPIMKRLTLLQALGRWLRNRVPGRRGVNVHARRLGRWLVVSHPEWKGVGR